MEIKKHWWQVNTVTYSGTVNCIRLALFQMFQKLPLSTLERVDTVSDATVGYIYSYPCLFLMMEAVSEILEMYSIVTWLTACKDFSATYVVRFSVLFLSLHFFFSATVSSQISYQLFYHQRPALCFGNWKTRHYSFMQCLSPGRCRVLHPIAWSVVFFIASCKV